jgi:hypothetical protein
MFKDENHFISLLFTLRLVQNPGDHCVLRVSRYGLKDENPYFNTRSPQRVTRNTEHRSCL